MNISLEKRTYRLTGLTPILGTLPANENIFSEYIASKAPTKELADEEIEAAKAREDMIKDPSGLSIFPRDMDAPGAPVSIMDYVIRGFFKAAGKVLSKQMSIAAITSKVDRYLFVEPRWIHLTRNGKDITEPDGWLQRSLRTSGPQGERTALAASEKVGEDGEVKPWQAEFTLTLLDNEATKRSNALDWELVETLLDYGKFSGLGQWRNASYGRFDWERVDENSRP